VSGIYVYAVMRGEPHLRLGPSGLPDGATAVSGVSTAGLTAVVSEYQGPALEDLSRADVLRALLIHQRVLEGAMGEGALIPVKFGTVLRSVDDVRNSLVRFHARLADAFTEVGDAVEIDLSATWDEEAVLADIGRDSELGSGRQNANGPPGEALEERIRVGSQVAELLEQRRDHYRQRAVTDLVPLARDVQPNPLPTEDLVFNLAFLVEREDLPRFEGAVDRLGEELGERLAFRYVGPLPPHSFATVEMIYPNPSEIESARGVLGLGDRVTPAELRRAYRDLAAEYHPDRNQGDPAASERFNELTGAHEILDRYIRGRRETVGRPNENHVHELTSNAVAGTVLLEIVRADVEPRARRTSHEREPAL
jgi:hypothetical protein